MWSSYAAACDRCTSRAKVTVLPLMLPSFNFNFNSEWGARRREHCRGIFESAMAELLSVKQLSRVKEKSTCAAPSPASSNTNNVPAPAFVSLDYIPRHPWPYATCAINTTLPRHKNRGRQPICPVIGSHAPFVSHASRPPFHGTRRALLR